MKNKIRAVIASMLLVMMVIYYPAVWLLEFVSEEEIAAELYPALIGFIKEKWNAG
jgi:hypothetical protein